MTKRLASLILAIAMFLQIIAPQAIFAKEEVKAPEDGLVTVGVINGDSYDAKLMLELNRLTAKNRVRRSADPGASLFGYFEEGQEPKNGDKLKYHGEVKADLKVTGLGGNPFQWNEIFGTEEVHLRFIQMNDETGVETGVERVLNVNQAGTYTWTDGEGNPAELPLFNNKLEPLTYEVKLDEEVSDKVKLLTARLTTTGNAGSPTFEKPDAEGRIKYHLTLEIGLQQVASSKFVSEWRTAVVEGERPQLQGTMTGSSGSNTKTAIFDLPKNDTKSVILRTNSLREGRKPDKIFVSFLYNKPTDIKVKADTTGLTFDTTNKTVTSGDHKFKYDFKYDVINGGKLTMTEIIPVTFDANGGKFANFTAPDTEIKIVKEVDYDGTLTDKAENPTKQGKAFKGWATKADGTTPAPDSEYENLIAKKTFYAIWSDEDIQAEELKTTESLIRFSNNRLPIITNDFVPTFEELKAQVKVKDASGNFVALPTTGVKFTIVDDKGTEYDKDSDDLKKLIYDKVKENNKDEVSRTEKVKAKITYDNGTEREIEIPIKVLKNIYKGTDQGGKYPHIPDDYVKVTIDPTDKAHDSQKTYYYVNPKANVIVPVTDPVGKADNKFSKWTMKADSATGDGADYKTADRHQFKEDSTITAQYGAGTIKIQYVDQNGDEIDAKYQIAGNNYPSDNSGGLGKEADELKFASKGPDFKGYIYSSRDSIKGKHYKDPSDPDKLDVVKYSYYKKVTTKEPTNKNIYFPVIFDANGGEFKPDTVTQKTVYVYFDGNNATVEKVTFKEVKDEFEKAFSNPTKDGFDFKEWQNAKTNGTKPADDYEIQFKGWDSQYNPTGDTFYAYYEEPGAFVKYLDLDGKPIADDFKIDGVEYPTEKTGKLGDVIASDVFTKDTAPKLIGYKFNRIEINPVNSKYALDNKATIKIYYEKLPDVIPAKDGSGNPNEKPVGYVEVKFVPTDKAKDTTEKIFYVNPKKDVTIPIADPVAKATYNFKEWKMGANADGAVYTPSTAQKFTEATTVITATYEETKNIIPYDPSAADPMVRPEGYVRVTFAADKGLKLTEQKAYYVKANAGITLGNGELIKPKYDVETGYKFKEWDKDDTTKIEASDIVVTAKATALPDYDTVEHPDYVKVTFKADTNGVIKDTSGNTIAEQVYYVNPKKFVKLPAPTPVGSTGYDFAAWSSDKVQGDFSLANYINYTEDTTITAKFNQKDAVYPKLDGSTKPTGYVEVTFKVTGTDGKIADNEITTYYVDPSREVSLKAPKTIAGTGFVFDGWRLEDNTTAAKINPADKKYYQNKTTIYGSFKKLDDIIPATNDDGTTNLQPDDYVAVLFIKGEHAQKFEGQVLYYVNPKAGKTIGNLTKKPTITPDTGWKYKGWDKADTTEIKDYMFVVAQYEVIDDVIKKIDANTKKPDGYVTVTFKAGDNGKIQENSAYITEKVYYVNPNVYVKLDAPNTVPDTGFVFGSWKSDGKVASLDNFIKYEKDTTITANFNLTGNVVPKTKLDDSEKPAGFVTVNFVIEGQGGQIEANQTITYFVKKGEAVTIHPPKTKADTGYEFDKWDKDTTAPTAYTDDVTNVKGSFKKLDDIIKSKEANGTINAKPEGYVTVQFLKGDHGVLDGQTTFYVNPNAGKKLEDLKPKEITIVPEKTYKFDEWDNDLTTNITGNIDVTAKYTQLPNIIKAGPKDKAPVGYVVVIFETDGRGTITGNAKYEEGNTPKKETEIVYFVNPDKGVKLAAADATASETVLPVPSTTPYDATKYGFDQWLTKIDTDSEITRGRVHIAIFKPKKVKMTYDANEATEGTAPEALSYDVGTEITLAGGNNLKKDNYVLTGWDIKGTTYAPGAKYKIEKDTTAKAVWEAGLHTVEFDTDGAGYIPAQKVKHGVKITKVDNPQKDGYTFIGWQVDGKAFDPTTSKVEKDITLVAQYTQDVIEQKDPTKKPNVPKNFVEVKFVPTDKATDETKAEKIFWVNPDKKVTIPVANPVAKAGFIFKEWKIGDVTTGEIYTVGTPKQFTDKNGTTITATYTESDNIIPVDPTKPTAKPEGYVTVTFDADLGLKLTGTKYYYVKKNVGITIGKLTKPVYQAASGYEFVKWDKEDSTKIEDKDIVVTALAKYTPCEPGYRPSYPEVIYRDKIVEKEKIVEKIVKVGENDEMQKEIRYMQGFNGKFRPYDGLRRCEAAQILANALKADGYRYDANYALSYSDVGNVWYTDAIRVVTQAGVFQGYSDGTFKPEGKITRAEWVATLRRFQDIKEASGNTMMLRNGHWATAEVEAAYEAGWLGVYQDGTAKFDADKPITRQEVAYVSNRAFRRVLDKVYLKRSVNTLLTYKDINPSMPLYEDILCASNTLLTDNRYYKANTVVMDNLTFNIVTDYLRIQQKKFQYNVIR